MVSGSGLNSTYIDQDQAIPAWRSSANKMRAPGSFPYGVSLTLDREGGGEDGGSKGVYCWGLDEEGGVVGEGVRVPEEIVGVVGVEEREVGEDGEGDVGSGEGGGGSRSTSDGKCGCRWESG